MTTTRIRATRRPRAGGLAAAAVVATAGLIATPSHALGGLSIDIGTDLSIWEGSVFQRSVPVVDAVDDGAPGWDYVIDYGDGTVAAAHTDTGVVTADHRYVDGPASRTLTVTVTDEPGETAIDSMIVSVVNVAPTPTPIAAASVAEGAVWSLTLAADDPAGATDPIGFALDWGDGTLAPQVILPPGTINHVFADGGAIYNVTIVAYDDDGGIGRATLPVSVTNVAPTIALNGATTVDIGTVYSLTLGTVTDPGRDTVSATTIRWGDGTSQAAAPGSTITHTYTTAGSQQIAVDLVDEDGAWTAAGSRSVTVATPAPTAPTGLAGVATGRSTTRLTWTNTTTNQTSIEVERCKGVGCTRFARVATLPGTAVSFSDSKLSSNTTYVYRVRAVNAYGVSAWSNVVTVRTNR